MSPKARRALLAIRGSAVVAHALIATGYAVQGNMFGVGLNIFIALAWLVFFVTLIVEDGQ